MIESEFHLILIPTDERAAASAGYAVRYLSGVSAADEDAGSNAAIAAFSDALSGRSAKSMVVQEQAKDEIVRLYNESMKPSKFVTPTILRRGS